MKLKRFQIASGLVGTLALCLLASGCGHHRRVQAPPPPPPPAELEQPAPPPPQQQPRRGREKVLSTQTGLASWYGTPYHNARSANGRVYNQNAMTAAHRTLPMGTEVRVTNLATHQSAVVTITDRGPFVRGRVIDLSRAAAIRTGVWRSGVARVRIDVLRYPASVDPDGRWCVQIGAFRHSGTAHKLRDRLQREYAGANVIDFRGATGYWVRIKPARRSQQEALQIASELHLREGAAYLVRLD